MQIAKRFLAWYLFGGALLAGCAAVQPAQLFRGYIPKPGDTAFIRVATGDDSERPKFSLLIRSHPYTRISGIVDLNVPEQERRIIATDSAEVMPGAYQVEVRCSFNGGIVTITETRDIRIDAQADKEYLLECEGSRPANADVSIATKDLHAHQPGAATTTSVQ